MPNTVKVIHKDAKVFVLWEANGYIHCMYSSDLGWSHDVVQNPSLPSGKLKDLSFAESTRDASGRMLEIFVLDKDGKITSASLYSYEHDSWKDISGLIARLDSLEIDLITQTIFIDRPEELLGGPPVTDLVRRAKSGFAIGSAAGDTVLGVVKDIFSPSAHRMRVPTYSVIHADGIPLPIENSFIHAAAGIGMPTAVRSAVQKAKFTEAFSKGIVNLTAKADGRLYIDEFPITPPHFVTPAIKPKVTITGWSRPDAAGGQINIMEIYFLNITSAIYRVTIRLLSHKASTITPIFEEPVKLTADNVASPGALISASDDLYWVNAEGRICTISSYAVIDNPTILTAHLAQPGSYIHTEAKSNPAYKDIFWIGTGEHAGAIWHKTWTHATGWQVDRRIQPPLTVEPETDIVIEGSRPHFNIFWFNHGKLYHQQLVGADAQVVSRVTSLSDLFFHEFLTLNTAIEAHDFVFINNQREMLKRAINMQHPTTGKTLLHRAVEVNDKKIIWLLLNHRANTQLLDNDGRTALQVAARLGYDKAVWLLLLNGACTEKRDRDGNTALHLAIIHGHENAAILIASFMMMADTDIKQFKNNLNEAPHILAYARIMKRLSGLIMYRYQKEDELGTIPEAILTDFLMELFSISAKITDFSKNPKVLAQKVHNPLKPTEPIDREWFEKCFTDLARSKEICPILNLVQLARDGTIRIAVPTDDSDVGAVTRYLVSSAFGVYFPNRNNVAVAGKRSGPNEFIGTLIHELTHLAAYEIYKNGCNPYYVYDEVKRDEFARICADIKERFDKDKTTLPRRVSLVFESRRDAETGRWRAYYTERDWHAELIVRVPQIIAEGDSSQIKLLMDNCWRLYGYYVNTFLVDCVSYVHYIRCKKGIVNQSNTMTTTSSPFLEAVTTAVSPHALPALALIPVATSKTEPTALSAPTTAAVTAAVMATKSRYNSTAGRRVPDTTGSILAAGAIATVITTPAKIVLGVAGFVSSFLPD